MPLDTAFFSNSGNDTTGTGSQLNPYATPKKAAQNLNPNGTMYGRGGLYIDIRGTNDSNDTFKDLPSGTTGYTTVMAFNGEPVELKAHAGSTIMIRTPDNFTKLRFQGLKLTGNAAGVNTQACFTGGGGAFAGSFLDILDCEISFFKDVAIQTASNSDGRLLDCSIHDIVPTNTGYGGYPIYINQNAHRWEVGRNTMFNLASYAIHHYSTSGQANSGRYHNNLIYNWATTGSSSALLVANGTDNWIWNNIVAGGTSVAGTSNGFETEWAQVGGSDTRNSIWAHNVAYGCPGYGFSFTQNGSNNLLINNIAVGNALGAIRDLEGTTKTTNLFAGTPSSIFVDAPNKNFHLRPTATSAIGQGTLHPSFLLDFDGQTRIAPVDIGPYATLTASILGHLAAQRRMRTVSLQLSGFR